MRGTAVAITGLTVLSGLLGAVALTSDPSAYARGGTVMAPDTVPDGHAGIRGRAPSGGKCRRSPEPGQTLTRVPYPQRMFGTKRIWPISTGKGVKVAVLDSGMDAGHPQLSGDNIGNGADFLRGNGSGNGRYDCDGHGTAVASLIAGQKVRNVGFQGLAYDARILPVVVADEYDEKKNATRTTSPKKLANAINWAVQQGAKVINISLIMTEDHSVVAHAIGNAVDNDVVVVAAVGNGAIPRKLKNGVMETPYPGPTPYPAAYPGVIGVGAVGPAKDGHYPPLKGSQWGTYVDLAAPGGQVTAANWGGGHTRVTGNGYAAPFVSAAAALVRSRWPDLSASQVARRLFATASPAAGARVKVGHGLVDPYRALTEGLSDESPAEFAPVKPASLGPKAAARAAEREFHGTVALTAGGVGVLLAGVMMATLTLLPKGNRRRWRPGRTKSFPQPKEEDDDMPPAPVKLFEDLETS